MVITQLQFNKAMEEINSSYHKLQKRLEALEARMEDSKVAPSKAKPKEN